MNTQNNIFIHIDTKDTFLVIKPPSLQLILSSSPLRGYSLVDNGQRWPQGKVPNDLAICKGKSWIPLGEYPTYQHIPPIYGIYNGCMG